MDLQSLDDNDIRKDQHISIVKYMLKHIRDRDLIKVWDNMFKRQFGITPKSEPLARNQKIKFNTGLTFSQTIGR